MENKVVVFLMEETMDFLKELPGEEETEENGEEEGKVSDLPEISLFNVVWYKSAPAQPSS